MDPERTGGGVQEEEDATNIAKFAQWKRRREEDQNREMKKLGKGEIDFFYRGTKEKPLQIFSSHAWCGEGESKTRMSLSGGEEGSESVYFDCGPLFPLSCAHPNQ